MIHHIIKKNYQNSVVNISFPYSK